MNGGLWYGIWCYAVVNLFCRLGTLIVTPCSRHEWIDFLPSLAIGIAAKRWAQRLFAVGRGRGQRLHGDIPTSFYRDGCMSIEVAVHARKWLVIESYNAWLSKQVNLPRNTQVVPGQQVQSNYDSTALERSATGQRRTNRVYWKTEHEG